MNYELGVLRTICFNFHKTNIVEIWNFFPVPVNFVQILHKVL